MDNLQYWVIGWTLALCAGSFFFVMVPVYAFRFVGAGKVPPLVRGKVSARGLSLLDALGVGFFFGMYAAMWLGMELVDPAKVKELKVTPLLLVGQLMFQGFQILLVILILFWRVRVVEFRLGLVEFFGLRWRQWWLAPIIGMGVVILILAIVVSLNLAGYDQWMAGLQNVEEVEDLQQDVVKMIKENKDPLTFALLALVACVGAPLSEEVVFRGYLYPVVKRFSNIPVAIIFTGLLFGAVHGNLAALLPLCILGMLLAAVYEWTGSLWAPIAVHALFNSYQVFLLKMMEWHPEWFEKLEKMEKAKEAAWIVLRL